MIFFMNQKDRVMTLTYFSIEGERMLTANQTRKTKQLTNNKKGELIKKYK